MEMCSLVEATVYMNPTADTELLDNQVLPFAHHLTEEHIIPTPVFQYYSSHVHRAAAIRHGGGLVQPLIVLIKGIMNADGIFIFFVFFFIGAHLLC